MKDKKCCSILFCVLLSFLCRAVCDDTFDNRHSSCIQTNPRGLSFKISTPTNNYHMGETIPITLTFSKSSTTEYEVSTRSYDRSGRLNIESFYVDGPSGGYSDPLATYFSSGAYIGGGLGSAKGLMGEYSHVLDLNEWVRFDTPGEYRAFCTSGRVHAKGEWSKHVDLCSQVIKLTIIPTNEAFISKTVREAQTGLASDKDDVRLAAARTLRFLSTAESVDALIPLFGDSRLKFHAFFGMIGSRNWKYARNRLYEKLEEPDIVVNSMFIRAIAHISLPPRDHMITFDPENPEQSRKQYRDLESKKKDVEKAAIKQLENVLARKEGRALAGACSLLLRRESHVSGLRKNLARSFQFLTEREQRTLLEYRWDTVRCPEFKPVLQGILEKPLKWEQWRDTSTTSLALLRYQEYEPREARAMIIADLKRPSPMLSKMVLLSLPDKFLPKIEDEFIKNLSGKSDLFKLASIIERYATAEVLPQVIKFYEKHEGSWACCVQESLLRYWVKHDRKKGLAATVKATGLREHTRCYTSVLGNVLSSHYGPDAEKIAISFLDDKEADVVVNVVRLLARKGSRECVDALLDRLATLNPEKKEVPRRSCFSDLSAYREIVQALLDHDKWELTDKQKRVLKGYLRTDSERAKYARRFGLEEEHE